MQPSSLIVIATAFLVPLSLAQNQSLPINITQVEEVDQTTRIGQLAYGASNLDFGYSAGAGINFGNGTVGGGFNAGIPGQGEGSLGGGWTVTGNGLVFGLGAVFNDVSVNIAVTADRKTGALSVQVNGKEVAL
ncbi:hypothetical protein BKA65DRAFT_539888 [Rhexocercosporidium sp. MPI-PUGE-AT-0058]|nr:hypothetical protein BKA65DRAFT_539888 [Rhexocercosporidium sp. MPI-PUGE-AT-0058]